MRAVTLLVRPPPEVDPTVRAGGAGFVRERIQHFGLLDDGTVVILSRVRGDIDALRETVASMPEVLACSVSGDDGDGSALVYTHLRPPAAVRRFVELPRRHEVFFEFPVETTPDGRLRVVMVGETNAALGRALADVPPEVEVTVERFGPYRERRLSVADLLTDRQREVLDVAVDLGYYEVPRRATHRDVAERLGLSVGTVSEHLQKIEARVFGSLVSGGA